MINAKKQFTTGDLEKVSQRIAALEQRTDAEVVCGVATESGRYDRAEALCGLVVGLLALISGNKLISLKSWDVAETLPMVLQVVLVVGGFVGGSLLASYWHSLRGLFVRHVEMELEVNRRAHQVFSRRGVGGTLQRGGMLIYLSLFERRLEVLCDSAAAAKVSQKDLETIRDAVLAKVRQGEVVEGLMAGLDQADDILAKVMPGGGEATSKLSNELLLFHPRP